MHIIHQGGPGYLDYIVIFTVSYYDACRVDVVSGIRTRNVRVPAEPKL